MTLKTPGAVSSPELEKIHRIEQIKGELAHFAKTHTIWSLEDRIKRGLWCPGILAHKETHDQVVRLCEHMGAQCESDDAEAETVSSITADIMKRGPWDHAFDLEKAQKPEIKIWLMMNAANNLDLPRETDLTQDEFLAHIDKVGGRLDEAIKNPDQFFDAAHQLALLESTKRFRIEDGVPIAEMDSGFIPMALQGFESGILHDADGMLYVGAKTIDDQVFEKWGLKKVVKDDERGRKNVPHFTNSKGEVLFKQIFPGFIVVLARNFDLAKAIARVAANPEKVTEDMALPAELFEHTLYAPTSSGPDSERAHQEEWGRKIAFFKRVMASPPPFPERLKGDGMPMRATDLLYDGMKYIKSHVNALSAEDALREKLKAKAKEPTQDQLVKNFEKINDKIEQKVDELKYLMSIFQNEAKHFDGNDAVILDMAGGAGDLGLAAAVTAIASGKPPKEVRIVDPFSYRVGLDIYTNVIVDYLPFREDLHEKVVHTNETIQEANIPDNAIMMAKHPCGDLADSLIERWMQSESPLLMIMTCCQDKACGKPARYNIAQEDWNHWCKNSSRTNIAPDRAQPHYEDQKMKLESGMEAMRQIDQARVDYLKRLGFEAELHQNTDFPKGNVIVARRKKKQ